jgi:hypothetical protein
MLDEAEAAAAREIFALARTLSRSDAVMARRAGERIAVILNDLLFENDPLGGLPAGDAIDGKAA